MGTIDIHNLPRSSVKGKKEAKGVKPRENRHEIVVLFFL